MAKFAKWIIGGLGWAVGGPLGGILGFMIGSAFDGMSNLPEMKRQNFPHGAGRGKTTANDFSMSLLVLAAAVMKSDNKHRKSELDYIKKFLLHQFGVERTRELTQMLRKLLNQQIPVRQVAHQIRYYMDHSARLQLLHFLFGVARADDNINSAELSLLKRISGYLAISKIDYESIKAMFIKSRESPYKILEVSPKATDDEVKKAYRKMAKKYHPDKVNHLGEDAKLAAKEKFQEVQVAYDEIKERRGIK